MWVFYFQINSNSVKYYIYLWTMQTTKQNAVNPSNLMTVSDFAKEQKVDRRTIYNWINEGKVKQVDFLKKSWVDKSTLKLK